MLNITPVPDFESRISDLAIKCQITGTLIVIFFE